MLSGGEEKSAKLEYSTNEIIRINNWTNQRRGFEEFSSGSSVNPRCARYIGAIAVFTSVCGTMEKSRAHQKFILLPGGALHMYVTLWLFNLHL
jgi:hypothetical protein